jgi:hypothetical protein
LTKDHSSENRTSAYRTALSLSLAANGVDLQYKASPTSSTADVLFDKLRLVEEPVLGDDGKAVIGDDGNPVPNSRL